MKSLVLIGLLMSGLVFGANFEVGQEVLSYQKENYQYEVHKIMAISNNSYQLENGSWHKAKDISGFESHISADSKRLKRPEGQTVYLRFPSASANKQYLQKVVRTADNGLVQLENGRWFNEYFLYSLREEYKNFKIGGLALIKYKNREIQKIQNIVYFSDDFYAMIQLEDGKWYRDSNLATLKDKSKGISVNDKVKVSSEEECEKIVVNIATDGLFQLEDGMWHLRKFLKKVN